MLSNRPDGLKITGPLYLLALLLVLIPAMDFIGTVLPFQGGKVEWRFSSVGLLSGFLMTPLLGIALAMMLAEANDHQIVQRLLAGVNFVAVLLFVAMLGVFVLDVIQMRSAVPADRLSTFHSAAIRAIFKHAAFVVALAWLARRGWVASRQSAYEAVRRPTPAPPGPQASAAAASTSAS